MHRNTVAIDRTAPVAERRRDLRAFADFQIVVVCQNRKVGPARLIDRSPLGLCIRHDLSLHVGDVITVMTPEVDVQARVVWAAVFETHREAGLEVLERD